MNPTLFRELPIAGSLPAVKSRVLLSRMPGYRIPLEESFAACREAGVGLIVSLAGMEEIRSRAPAYAKAIEGRLLPCNRIEQAIPESGKPKDRPAFIAFIDRVAGILGRGAVVLIHCAEGHGRTGLVAICLLLRLGLGLEEAKVLSRSADAEPEEEAQWSFVDWYARYLSTKN